MSFYKGNSLEKTSNICIWGDYSRNASNSTVSKCENADQIGSGNIRKKMGRIDLGNVKKIADLIVIDKSLID